MFGDQTRTILPQEGKQVQIKMDKLKIITDRPVYWQKSGTKIQPICNSSAYIGIAGDEKKSKAFVQSVQNIKKVEEFNSFVNQYWLEHGEDSPDQFLLLSKKHEKVYAEYYFKCSEERFNAYVHYVYTPKDDKIVFAQIGSGSQAFSGFIQAGIDGLEKQYNEATKDETLLKWEKDFVEKIKSIYTDIHHQISSVGDDVDFVTVDL